MPDWWTKRGMFKVLEPSELDLNTVAACERFIRKKLRELAEVVRDYEAARPKAVAEGDEAALVKARKSLDCVIDLTGDIIFEVLKRQAMLEAAEA